MVRFEGTSFSRCAVVSVEEFIAGLTQSGLMTAEEVHAFEVSLPPTEGASSVKCWRLNWCGVVG